jgi:hypothetical protein
MPRTKISEFSATAADNTDINGINLAEGMLPSDVNNSIRELMAQIKDLQAGTSGDTIPITAGGTGATSASAARTALGATTTGNDLFTAVDDAAARTAIGAGTGNGSVTSVAASVPDFLSVSGSPVTTSGTLTISYSGTALPVANGGTGVTSAGAAGNVLTSDGTAWISSAAPGALPVGTLQYFHGATTTTYPGNEWLKCDGSALTQTAYSELFSNVGLIVDNAVITWTSRTSGTASNINAVAYGNGVYVYGGDSGVVATSTDAITWTTGTTGSSAFIFDLIYADGIFVAARSSGGIFTSTDGITWTSRTSGTASNITALTYGDNLYVAAGAGGNLRTSTDGITWTSRSSGTTFNIAALTYGDNLYVAAGNNGTLRTSTNAITWTARTSGTATTILSLAYGDNLYVAAGNGGVLRTSTDGITWTAVTSGTANAIESLVYGSLNGNNLYIAGLGTTIANNILTSTDAITWTVRATSTGSAVNGLVYENNNFVAVMDGGKIQTSSFYNYDFLIDFILPTQTTSRPITNPNLNPSVFSEENSNLFIKAE